MLYFNVERSYQLQGDMPDVEFARKLHVSRQQLWRIRSRRSSVGAEFVAKFKAAFPNESIDDFFYTQ